MKREIKTRLTQAKRLLPDDDSDESTTEANKNKGEDVKHTQYDIGQYQNNPY